MRGKGIKRRLKVPRVVTTALTKNSVATMGLQFIIHVFLRLEKCVRI